MNSHVNSAGGDPIYVESRIRASMDALWSATQEPERHRRWDVRFGEIEYLPRGRRRAAAVPLRHDGRAGADGRRHGRDARRPQPSRRLAVVGPQVLGQRLAIDHRRRCRLLALRPHRRRDPLPHPLRLPAALGSIRRVDRPHRVPAAVRMGDRVELRPPAALAGGRHAARDSRATRPSPTPSPPARSPASGCTTVSCRSSGRPTPTS